MLNKKAYRLQLSKIFICLTLQVFTRPFGGWGWDWTDKEHTRPIRNHYFGIWGQEISYSTIGYKHEYSPLQKRIKNWLIWGYFDTR